jgi:hypothetical protein
MWKNTKAMKQAKKKKKLDFTKHIFLVFSIPFFYQSREESVG